MKKIININLNGRVLPIEDTAYESLQAYIESLRRYFANEESRDEIINDIESRIAELLHEKIRKGASAITDADVNEVIVSMGTVADFEAEEKENAGNAGSTSAQGASSQGTYSSADKRPRGRLYRDSNDKFLGGVCSGIAAYLNVDPAVVRLLFAIIGFGTGIGFLAYIILWIVLPPRDLEGFQGKRLYRNPDDRVIGGVAGGLAAYFDKRASTIRLIFAAPILLNILISILNGFSWHSDFDLFLNLGFGSLTGTFMITYLILWIVLPEANSDYEKMEMRGERVDVNRIRQNVKEGMGNMRERMKDWSEEVKTSAQQFGNKARDFAGTSGRAFNSDVNQSFRRRSNGIGHVIGVIIKAFFLFIGGVIALSLFLGLIALIFGGVAWWPVHHFLWTSKAQQLYAYGTLIFFLIVPLVAFLTWIIRRVARVRSRNNYLGWTFGGLWTLGWIVMILFVSSLVKDFREYEHVDTAITTTQPANGKMIVMVSQDELEYRGSFGWLNDGDGNGWDLSSDTLRIAAVKFNVKPSTDDQYRVILKRYSFGRSGEEARARAEKIQYAVTSRDSILDLGNGYAIDSRSKFRGQYVEVEIQVPIGKKLRFDASVTDKLNSLDIHVRRSGRRNRISSVDIDNDRDDFWYKPNIDYVMSADGELRDPLAPAAVTPASNDNKNYRYEPQQPVAADSLQQQIDRERKLREESERREKELRDRQRATGKTVMLPSNKQKRKNDESFAIVPTPASSLIQWF